jgi:acetyl esterase/lipase
MTLITRRSIGRLGLMVIWAVFIVQPVPGADETPAITGLYDLSYVSQEATANAEQTLDLYRRVNENQKQPVVIYVHGGGWAFGDKGDVGNKAEFFTLHSLAFISMNYRLRWEYTIFDQLTDVAGVVKWVSDNATKYSLDPDRVILMGSGSGAHLVSLIGTDNRYLETVGLSIANIVAVVAIEGDVYDMQQNIEVTSSFLSARHLKLIFGENPEVWKAASAVNHVAAGKRIPAFALMYMPDNKTATQQANLFAKRLSQAHVETIIMPGDPETSKSIDKTLGTPGDRSSLALVTFIRAKI